MLMRTNGPRCDVVDVDLVLGQFHRQIPPINQKVLENPEEKKKALSEIPCGRFGKPEEVAAVAAFLASQEADYVTASTYYTDGGLTQHVTKY